MTNDDKELVTKMNASTRVMLKISLYLKFVWVAAMLFALAGWVLGHMAGFIMLITLTSAWAAIKIVDEAKEAYTVLRIIKEIDAENAEKKNDET